MPPQKRKGGPAEAKGQQPPKKKAVRPSGTKAVSENALPTVDYEMLAAAIIRQQQDQTRAQSPEVTTEEQGEADIETHTSVPITADSASATYANPSSSSNTVQESGNFANFLSQIFAGESVAPNYSSQVVTPLSIEKGIPLGAHVPMKLKSKIWSNQFIQFRSLLPSHKENDIAIKIEQNSIQLSNNNSNQSQISLNQWTTAFFIYMAIYLEKKPEEAPHLLKYGHTVRELATSNGDNSWRYYDENFRKLKETNDIPWQMPVAELMVRACTIPRPKQPFRGGNSGGNRGQDDQRVKVCYNYNNGSKCTFSPCRFKHICQACKGNHPRVKCNKEKGDKPKESDKAPNNSKK